MTPVLKSIQPAFFSASGVLVEIFRVGAGAENGVPRPVEKRMRCGACGGHGSGGHEVIAGAVEHIQALGDDGVAVADDVHDGAVPPFWTQPQLLSSNVVMPPCLLPGEGLS